MGDMNDAHLHLLVNHLPILGFFLAFPVLLVALWRRREPGVMVAAAALLALAGAGGPIAEETGEGAEEVVENLPDVSEAAIHQHEERAELAVPVGIVTGLLAVGVAVWSVRRGSIPVGGVVGVLAANVVAAAAAASVGLSGGAIRHSEIRDESLTGGLPAMAERLEHEEGEDE
jgi:hypothetical protein